MYAEHEKNESREDGGVESELSGGESQQRVRRRGIDGDEVGALPGNTAGGAITVAGERAIRVGGVVCRVVGVVVGGRVVVVVSGGGGVVVVVVVAVGWVVVVVGRSTNGSAVSFAENALVTCANAWHRDVIGGAGGADAFRRADG
jgi:hypothetical protein